MLKAFTRLERRRMLHSMRFGELRGERSAVHLPFEDWKKPSELYCYYCLTSFYLLFNSKLKPFRGHREQVSIASGGRRSPSAVCPCLAEKTL